MRTRRLLEATAIGALVLWPTLAWASPGPGPGEAKFEEGVRAFEKGNYGEAVDDFNAAYNASHSATHLWNLALAEIKFNRPWEAYRDLTAFMMSPDANPEDQGHGSQLLKRVETQLGHLAIYAPAGAEILVDGETKGKAPLALPLLVDPMKPHLVEGHLGQRVAHSNVPAPGSSRIDVKLDFPEEAKPLPAAAPVNHEPAPLKPASAPAEEEDHVPNEGLLGVLVLTEVAAGAAGVGVGTALFMNGNNDHDSGKQTLGGVLVGAGALFLVADVLTLRLWPRSSKPEKSAASQVLISPSLGGLTLHGAF